jgi:hypothetical protein
MCVEDGLLNAEESRGNLASRGRLSVERMLSLAGSGIDPVGGIERN